MQIHLPRRHLLARRLRTRAVPPRARRPCRNDATRARPSDGPRPPRQQTNRIPVLDPYALLVRAVLSIHFDRPGVIRRHDDMAIWVSGTREVSRGLGDLSEGRISRVGGPVGRGGGVRPGDQRDGGRVAEVEDGVFGGGEEEAGSERGDGSARCDGGVSLEHLDGAVIPLFAVDAGGGPDVGLAVFAPADDVRGVFCEAGAYLAAVVFVAAELHFEVFVAEAVDADAGVVARDEELDVAG